MSADDKAVKQDSLPFPPTPSASIAGRTVQESVYKRRVEPRRLPVGSPNILIVLIDDAGPGLPSAFGGRRPNPDHEPRGQGRDRIQFNGTIEQVRVEYVTAKKELAATAHD